MTKGIACRRRRQRFFAFCNSDSLVSLRSMTPVGGSTVDGRFILVFSENESGPFLKKSGKSLYRKGFRHFAPVSFKTATAPKDRCLFGYPFFFEDRNKAAARTCLCGEPGCPCRSGGLVSGIVPKRSGLERCRAKARFPKARFLIGVITNN